MSEIRGTATLALLGLILGTAGCGGGDAPAKEEDKKGETTPASATAETEGHNHGGWWCGEHGVPEAECSLCSSAAAAKCKEKGDWCEEHNRAESQCFECNPAQAEKFAKLYEAKFGHAPPKPTE